MKLTGSMNAKMGMGVLPSAFFALMIVACVLFMGLPSQANALVAAEPQAESILFVGNSFTKHGGSSVASSLEALAEANGKSIDAQAIVYSRTPLSRPEKTAGCSSAWSPSPPARSMTF